MKDLEADIYTLELNKLSPEFPQKLYAALCNQGWRNGESGFTCSWRYAGGIAASLASGDSLGQGNYLEYYCSGNEGQVDDEVKKTLGELGWEPCSWAQAMALRDPESAKFWLGREKLEQWVSSEHQVTSIGSRHSQEDGSCEMTFYTDQGELSFKVDRQGSAYPKNQGGWSKIPLLEME